MCQSSGGWGELIYRAGSVAAVEKIRCVKGKLHVGNTRGDVIKLAVGQRYGIWHSPCLSKPTAQRYETKSLTLIVLSIINVAGSFLKDRRPITFFLSPLILHSKMRMSRNYNGFLFAENTKK